MTKKTITTIKIKASSTRVLCDGYTKTSVGGCVYCPEAEQDKWREMNESTADELIAENLAAAEEAAAVEEGSGDVDVEA